MGAAAPDSMTQPRFLMCRPEVGRFALARRIPPPLEPTRLQHIVDPPPKMRNEQPPPRYPPRPWQWAKTAVKWRNLRRNL